MRVVVATDKFAGTLTASEACDAVSSGWLEARPDDDVRCVPMADGGPGTVDVVAGSGRGEARVSETVNQLGVAISATWLALDHDTALIEVSSACGLDLVPATDRHPAEASSRGVGRLLEDISALGYARVIVGLGGSATVDGGLGAALGMGAGAFDSKGDPVAVRGPIDFPAVARVTELPSKPPQVIAAMDVANPLLGSNGAARVFGPQKGADPGMVDLLEGYMSHLADVVERSLPGGPWRYLPGAGAAGGLGFGLMAWTGARMVGGAETVAGLVGLAGHLDWAEVVVTGEGSIDVQTLSGKAPAWVAGAARDRGLPVLAVAGRADGGAQGYFDAMALMGDRGLSDPQGCARTAGAELARSFE